MDMMESPQKHPLAETFERVWSQALLAVSTAEDEATRCAHRVAELAGWSQEEVIRQTRLLTDRLAGHRKDLEHNVDEGVKRALSHLKVPCRDEMQNIESRLVKLAARLDARIEAMGQHK